MIEVGHQSRASEVEVLSLSFRMHSDAQLSCALSLSSVSRSFLCVDNSFLSFQRRYGTFRRTVFSFRLTSTEVSAGHAGCDVFSLGGAYHCSQERKNYFQPSPIPKLLLFRSRLIRHSVWEVTKFNYMPTNYLFPLLRVL